MTKVTHIANPNETTALCGRTSGNIKQMGEKRLVALSDDKCKQCLKTATYISIQFTDAGRSRLLKASEVAAILNL